MRRLSAILFGAVLIFAVAGSGVASARTLRLGHIRDTNYPTHIAALKFKELVEAGSHGTIDVKIYPNSQLGDAKAMFVQMQTGDLDMVYGGINTFSWINGGEAYEITSIPFLFRDYTHMKKALEADFFQPIAAKAQKDTGIRIIAISGDTAPRGLTTRDRPVRNAAEFSGLKIRTAASPTVLKAMKVLGALPQQVPLADLYMALKTGVVDAQENGAMAVASMSLFEVQKYYVKTDYIRDIETFYMSGETWNKLSDAERSLITKSAETAGEYETKLLNDQMNEVYGTLRAKMTVIDNADLGSVRQALKGAFDDYEGSKWPKGLLTKIEALQ